MQFAFTNDIEGSMVKSMLGRHGVSKRLLAKIKFDGGLITVNGEEQNAIHKLHLGDVVTITTPNEPDNEFLVPDDIPLNILFEDEHYLVVEKPAGKPSITGSLHPTGAMSNAVKGYISRQNYANQTVHIITRLDRDTSGIMFFAKHRYAHALMVQHKFRDTLEKRYFALVNSEGLPDSGEIDLPIGRCDDSIIKRQVRRDEKAKTALTSFISADRKNNLALLDITLHTGRTHQIRVHFSHLGYPLIGDDLYGGNHDLLERQALHCHHLQFLHPFTDEMVHIELDMPEDMKRLLT
ncbi:RluA family pseudouridine synthase [Lactococcus allomyrinae]|uniref:Pseudouridine synthase n=1 Tax=Lactococcus allomyrinae TaxID=2419773 RepID=A0A387BGL7_9LACT|nr:RluA family pseudouridine synthase [Lactococcus allomyrinae]AYG01768.1 RluA family pseudouridine synthase [Lactococcus allomyrinae]